MDTIASPPVPALRSTIAASARMIERPLMRCLEAVCGGSGGGGCRDPSDRCHCTLRVPVPADLDRRIGPGGVSLAWHDRRDRRAEPRRTYAHDRADRQGVTRTAARPGSVRGSDRPAVSGGGHSTGYRIRPGGYADRDAWSRYIQGVADSAPALRLRDHDHRGHYQAVSRLSRRVGARAYRAGGGGCAVRSDGRPMARKPRQPEPDPVLRGSRRRHCSRWRADRHCLRGRHVFLHGADHRCAYAAVRRAVL